MKRRQFLAGTLGASTAAASSVFNRSGLQAGRMPKTGYAETDITPEPGMEQPGGYGKAYLKDIHDPCKARAAVFDDGAIRVALVGVDTLGVPDSLVASCRRAITSRCGIEENAILIGASHSHSSGPLEGVLPGEFDHASEFVRKLAYEHSTAVDPRYYRKVETEIVNAVCRASEKRAESLCGFGFGIEDKVAFNRRFRMANGLSYTHPGQGNPDILGPAGPTDPQVGVIGTWDKEGKLTGCVVNYCCHATTSPGGVSANWIYYLEQTIRGVMGPDAIVVYLQGHCGDVTQVDNLSPYRHPSNERWAQLVGGRVGAEAVKTLLSMHPGSFVPVNASTKTLHITRRTPSPERVKHCYEVVRKSPKEAGQTEWTFAKEIVLLDAMLQKASSVNVEAQAVQVGPAVFLASPGEMFVDFGLDLKARSPFPFTFPVAYANGSAGYIPTEQALGKNGGGYETRLTSYSNLELTAGQQLNDAALTLAAQFVPGAVPEPPKAPPFGTGSGGIGVQPWSYGNVPPELS